jgi:hypothetical protein
MESNFSMIEKIPPKGVSFSDFICTFAMPCYDYRIFYAGGFVFISHKDKYSTGYGLFALQVLGCRAIS